MKACFRVIERVAETDDPVLVRGETGAGKELAAAAIHRLSSRPGPYKAINCAALPANLLESELFGHVRGAFTGAHKDTPGHVQLAHRGTLFLDEVAELPLELQAKLLRVLETRTVLPVGARNPVEVDVRVVSATHRALRREVEAGRFRADLMYRLRVIPIFLPPLRERLGDVALLCEQLLPGLNKARRRQVEQIAPDALAALVGHDWPGNVREQRNVLAYAHTMGDGPILEREHLPPEILDDDARARQPVPVEPRTGGTAPRRAQPRVGALDREQILEALASTSGRAEAAQRLGVNRITLWRHMKALGLVSPAER